jgi:acyl-CoA thioesterase-2
VNSADTLFGGQILSQSLLSAERTIEGIAAHSMHAYFLRPGSAERPVIYEVERIRDGRSFATRRVVAKQSGKAIYAMSVSFHNPEQGHSHQLEPGELPDLPSEADLANKKEFYRETEVDWEHLQQLPSFKQFDYLPISGTPYMTSQVSEPRGGFWIRSCQRLPADPVLQRAALAAATDMGLVNTCLFPHPSHPFLPNQVATSLDHAIWFHADADLSEWLLYKTDSPWTGGGRGLARGLVYDQQGRLIASSIQEDLIRILD